MTIKTTLPAGIAISLLLLGGGCKKGDASSTAAPDQSGATAIGVAPPTTAPQTGVVVATYPDTVPQSGTKQLLQPFTVYQAADATSPVLTRVSTGQWINLKGSRANWMLIEWPSGVGQMSPGWIESRATDSRLSQTPPPAPTDAGAPPPAPTVVDAGKPVDAAAPAPTLAPRPSGRGVVLKPRH